MNELSIRKLKLNFVTESYASYFEKSVIDTYMETAELPQTEFGIPVITDNIMFSLNPVFHASAILAVEENDPLAFQNALEITGDEDEVDYAMEVLEDITSDANISYYHASGYDGMYHDDVEAVLNFHKMCFVDVVINPFKGPSYWLENLPMTEVW